MLLQDAARLAMIALRISHEATETERVNQPMQQYQAVFLGR
jgi:hypothetical protein